MKQVLVWVAAVQQASPWAGLLQHSAVGTLLGACRDQGALRLCG